jgi:hypothetical protein
MLFQLLPEPGVHSVVQVAPSLKVSPGPGLVGVTDTIALLNLRLEGAIESTEEAEAEVAMMTAALQRAAKDVNACIVVVELWRIEEGNECGSFVRE